MDSLVCSKFIILRGILSSQFLECLRAFMVTPIGRRGLEPRRILVSNLAYPKTVLEFRRNGIFIESVEKKNLAL